MSTGQQHPTRDHPVHVLACEMTDIVCIRAVLGENGSRCCDKGKGVAVGEDGGCVLLCGMLWGSYTMPKLTRQDQQPAAGRLCGEGRTSRTSSAFKLIQWHQIDILCANFKMSPWRLYWHAATVQKLRNSVIMRPAPGKQFSQATRRQGKQNQDPRRTSLQHLWMLSGLSCPFFPLQLGLIMAQPNALTATVAECGWPMMLIGFDVGSTCSQ